MAAQYPSFPPGTKFEYLAEGAANIVYKFELPVTTPQESSLEEYEEGEPVPGDVDLSSSPHIYFQSECSVFSHIPSRASDHLLSFISVS